MSEGETAGASHFFAFESMPFAFKRAGVHIKSITGENVQMNVVQLDPDFKSDHEHPHEQIGFVLAGEVELTIEGDTRVCGKGDGYHIPPNVRHSFTVVSEGPAELLEVFSPPKEENRT